MNHKTTPEKPITLPDPTRPPKPAPGCDRCAALDKQREAAEKAGDIRLMTTYEVEILNHRNHKDQAEDNSQATG